ncbi:MAG: hypothetical protein AAGG75_21695 [Bacteroidota bacterium]
MKANNISSKILDNLWPLLKGLGAEAKLELASRLIDSLKSPDPTPNQEEDWRSLYGAWKDEEESAEEMIQRIRESRLSNRQLESFD